MGKILISEDQLEILTGHVLFNEQEEELKKDRQSDEERLGFKTSVESGEYETYEGGKPYELFLAKTDIKSKAYFQSGDFTESESKSLYYKYRRPNPISIQIKELMEVRNKWVKAQISYFDDKGGEEAAFVWWAEKAAPKMGAKLKKLQERLKELLPRKNITKEFQYTSNKPDNFKKGGWEKNPDYNEDGAKEDKKIAQVKKKVGDVTFSPADRLEVMYQIVQFVKKQYDGDYDAAASDKVWKRKGSKLIGSGWVKRGIETIVLRPENIQIKEVEEEEVISDEGGTHVNIWPSDADGQLFLNNLWEPSPLFEKQIDEMVNNILINKANVSKRFGGVGVKMAIATQICSGGGATPIDCSKTVNYPYTISSSCSQVPNGVNDKGEKLVGHGGTAPVEERISFAQLSQNRANTAKTLIAEKLGAIGVEMTEPVINWKGENSDVPGTSGPAYKQGGPVESEAYKLARYVKIQLAIRYIADIAIPEKPEPVQYKVGDLKVVIKADYESWDPWWRIPPIKWPNWKPFGKKFKNKKKPRGGYNTIACPKFGMKGSLSRKSRTSMSSRR